MHPIYIIIACLTVCANVQPLDSFNILGVFPYQGKSHFFVFKQYLEELSKRGHNVTVISYFPRKEPMKNYQDISLAGKTKIFEDIMPIDRSYITLLGIGVFLATSGVNNCKVMLGDENVQQLWKSNAKFDLVVTEQFNSDCSLGLAYQLGAPVVGINSHALMPWHYNRFGIPYNPSYMSFMFLEGGTKPTLYQRLERTVFDLYFNLVFKLYIRRENQNTLAEYFDDVPPLEELARDIKFLLLYNDFVLWGSTLLPANVKEVSGYHVAEPKPLPDEIRKFIEESKHGVIYISFGSMLRATSLAKDKLEAIIGAVSKLPQRVIWKWEENVLPGNPKDILISKWLPQNDILAHPKVIAFYSHCGLLGTYEAVTHGVPIVAMPIFGDQPGNAGAIVESGMGVQINLKDLTEKALLEKFQTIIEPKFQEKVKLISKVFRDRPMSAMDSAIYWTEFAARTSNFTFRSPSADVPMYQYLCLDVIAVFSIIFLSIGFILKKLISLCWLRNAQVTKNKVKKQ